MRRPLIPVLLSSIVACAALTACGSTVDLGAQGASGDALSSGLDGSGLGISPTDGLITGNGTGDGAAQVGGSTAAGGGADAGSSTGALPGGTDGASTSGAGSTLTDGASGTARPGSSPTGAASVQTSGPARLSEVEVGMTYFPDVASFASILGGSSSSGDDELKNTQLGMMHAAFDWANANGGLAGHKIKPVLTPVKITGNKTYSQLAQEVCTAWTQDAKVVTGILAGASLSNELASCLTQKKVLYLAGGHYVHQESDYRNLPYMITPLESSMEQTVRNLVSYLLKKGTVKSGDKIGMLHMDYASVVAGNKLFTSLMKAKGVEVLSFEVPAVSSTAAIGSSLSAVQSAELRLKSAGVKTVAFLCPGCLAFFLKNAESQKYYPTYVLSSFDTLTTLPESGSGKQLTGALGIGWNPSGDVGTFSNPSVFTNPTRALCTGITRKFVKDEATEQAAAAVCDSIAFLRQAAIAGGTTTVTGESLLNGVNNLGSSFPSALTFGTKYASGRHYGATSYRGVRYEYSCDCMRYDGPVIPFS